ncbi:putative inactive leucine-rich repeat receptor-like protein kinase [Salvia divinorum]|uniref:Inactive leucine-rich repeat receptor-like protein kinase n=1 Tax=Salvia divinorum TaxID=28513 RepID=A0ABD1GZD0_SALDI
MYSSTHRNEEEVVKIEMNASNSSRRTLVDPAVRNTVLWSGESARSMIGICCRCLLKDLPSIVDVAQGICSLEAATALPFLLCNLHTQHQKSRPILSVSSLFLIRGSSGCRDGG